MKKLTLMSIIVLVFLAALSLSAIQCKPPKQEFNGKCYYPNDLGKVKATSKKKQAARRRARKRADKRDCEEVRLSDTKYDWEEYLEKHPKGVCREEASDRIDEIEREAKIRATKRREEEKRREESRKAEEARRAEEAKFPLRHAGLRWSKVAPKKMKWKDAKNYCEDLGGRLPTIRELRTLIKNCPKTETDGGCGVRDSCLNFSCWKKNNKACYGCGYRSRVTYSVFGDKGSFWSSSARPDHVEYAWGVHFGNGHVNDLYWEYEFIVRCVR